MYDKKMCDENTIKTDDLQRKRRELIGISEQAKLKWQEALEKIRHIDYVLEQFTEERVTRGHNISEIVTPIERSSTRQEFTIDGAIVEVLKRGNRPLSRNRIHDGVLGLGTKCTMGSFGVALTKLVNRENPPIERVGGVGSGLYRYILK